MDLPKTSKAKVTGSLGASIVETLAKTHKWIYRSLDTQDDFGIDGELEIVNDDLQITGVTAKVQIKSHDSITWNDGAIDERVELKHINYWMQSSAPVILITVDTSDNSCYWASTREWRPSPRDAAGLIRTKKSQQLPSTFDDLRSLMIIWNELTSYQTTLRDIIGLHEEFVEFDTSFSFGSDMECEIESIDERRLFGLYERVWAARFAFGLESMAMFPADFWRVRERLAWRLSEHLHYPTACEMLAYLRSFFIELVPTILEKTRVNEPMSREWAVHEHFEAVQENFYSPKVLVGEPIYLNELEGNEAFGAWMNEKMNGRATPVYGFGSEEKLASEAAMHANAPKKA